MNATVMNGRPTVVRPVNIHLTPASVSTSHHVSPTLLLRPNYLYQRSASPNRRLWAAAIANAPEVAISTPKEKHQVLGIESNNDAGFYSEEALVADYQYTLRYYKALKRQIGAWKAEFVAQNRRQPSVEDAAAQCGRDFGLLYGAFIEVRARLMVELPRLKARLQASVGVSGSGNAAGDPASPHGVNANNPVLGLVNTGANAGLSTAGVGPSGSGAHHHLNQQQQQQQQQQMVDSVSTWLRADRYRRQRAAADAAVQAASGSALRLQPPGLGHPGAASGPTPSYPLTHSQEHPHQGEEAQRHPTPSSRLGPAAAPASRVLGAEGLRAEQDEGGTAPSAAEPSEWVPYQPVIQLMPLDARLQAPGRGAGASSAAAGARAGVTDASGAQGSGGGHEDGDGSRPRQHALVSERRGDVGGRVAAGRGDSSRGGLLRQAEVVDHGNAEYVPDSHEMMPQGSAAQAPAAGVPTLGVRQGDQESCRHLEADAHLASDSRARNALLAALQYKRTAKAPLAASAVSRGNKVEVAGTGMGRGREYGQEDGGAGPGSQTKAVEVEVEVRRGDTAGAYSGRNRRTEELPESFMLCP